VGRNQKGALALQVVKRVASLNPPGRFLELQPDGRTWKEISRKKAVEKASQALREKKWDKNAERRFS